MPVVVQGVAGLLVAAYLMVSGFIPGHSPGSQTEYIKGNYGDYEYSAVVYENPSKYGIFDGRVSKLIIRKDNEVVANYDRGWDIVPEGNDLEVLMDIVDKLEDVELDTEKGVDEAFAPFIQEYGEELAEEYMWMYTHDWKGEEINAYKNINTREYVHISEDGTFYEYTGKGYKKVNKPKLRPFPY